VSRDSISYSCNGWLKKFSSTFCFDDLQSKCSSRTNHTMVAVNWPKPGSSSEFSSMFCYQVW